MEKLRKTRFMSCLIVVLASGYIFLISVTPQRNALSQTDSTVEAGVNQLFTQTAQANFAPATQTVTAIQTSVQKRFNDALTATASRGSQTQAQFPDIILDPLVALHSRDAKTLTAPGWRNSSQFTAQTTIDHAAIAFWTKPGSGYDWFYWSFAPEFTGTYELFAVISTPVNAPAKYTQLATYHVSHADGGTAVNVDQSANMGQRTSLGKFRFQAGEKYAVFLDSNTSERGDWAIIADQLKIHPLSVTSEVVANTPTPQPLKTVFGFKAFAKADARLWTAPNVQSSKKFKALKAGQELVVIAGPLYGSISSDTASQGDWYQVEVGQGTAIYGWIWSRGLSFGG